MHGNFRRLAKLMSWRQWWDWWWWSKRCASVCVWEGGWRWGLEEEEEGKEMLGLYQQWQINSPLPITFLKSPLIVEREAGSFSVNSHPKFNHRHTAKSWLLAICESFVYSQFFLSKQRRLLRLWRVWWRRNDYRFILVLDVILAIQQPANCLHT